MIFVVASEPSPWLGPLLQEYPEAEVFAPWALPQGLPTGFLKRRALQRATRVPGWTLLEAGLAAWAGHRTERRMELKFRLRRWVDELTRVPRGATTVIAPSCGALKTFARARRRGAETVLVQDLPGLREMHRDLDHAAARHPNCRFLQRYRAPRETVVRQEAERVLSDRRLGRGPQAGAPLPWPKPRGAFHPAPGRLCLAGLATGRSGVMEALEMLKRFPDYELEVRPGEGLEPAGLLHHPRVVTRQGAPSGAVLLAPAWCESYCEEIELARSAGVPVVGTRRAAGWSALDAEIEPGDVNALESAIRRLTMLR